MYSIYKTEFFYYRVTQKARLSSLFVSATSLSSVDDLGTPTSVAIKFINMRDSRGHTPLQVALNNEHVENAKILIKRGADINIRYE